MLQRGGRVTGASSGSGAEPAAEVGEATWDGVLDELEASIRHAGALLAPAEGPDGEERLRAGAWTPPAAFAQPLSEEQRARAQLLLGALRGHAADLVRAREEVGAALAVVVGRRAAGTLYRAHGGDVTG